MSPGSSPSESCTDIARSDDARKPSACDRVCAEKRKLIDLSQHTMSISNYSGDILITGIHKNSCGRYVPDGWHEGRPCWKKQANGARQRYLYRQSLYWVIGPMKGSESFFARRGLSAEPTDIGGWEILDLTTNIWSSNAEATVVRAQGIAIKKKFKEVLVY